MEQLDKTKTGGGELGALAKVGKQLGNLQLRFAEEADLQSVLGVEKGTLALFFAMMYRRTPKRR